VEVGEAPDGRRVVVTGIGLINPLGIGREPFWGALTAGRVAIAPIERFDSDGLPVRVAAEVRDFRAADLVPRRLIAKSDRFAHHAMAAAELAFQDADLEMTSLDPFRVGISFGNNSGGWDICERGFEEYYRQGPSVVNAWQATAWFPTAPQGFVSIRYGIRGFSKSFAADRASGACGVLFGHRSIRWGHNDVVLTGGAEAPVTRLGMASHVTTGELSLCPDPARAYLPFDAARSGLVLGEGSTVLVLESLEHARGRGARIYAEVLAVEQRTGDPERPDAMESALRAALRTSGTRPEDVDVVFAEGCGTPAGDRSEAQALRRVFGNEAPCPPVTAPRAAYGHLFGASFATELACGLLAMRCGVIPGTAGTTSIAPECEIPLVREPAPAEVRRVVVNARSREGTNVALVAARWPNAI